MLNCEKALTTSIYPFGEAERQRAAWHTGDNQSHHHSSYRCTPMSLEMALLLCVWVCVSSCGTCSLWVMCNLYLFLLCHSSAKVSVHQIVSTCWTNSLLHCHLVVSNTWNFPISTLQCNLMDFMSDVQWVTKKIQNHTPHSLHPISPSLTYLFSKAI